MFNSGYCSNPSSNNSYSYSFSYPYPYSYSYYSRINEAIGPIVDCQAQYAAVVCV
jgi:hypothetical protein